MTAGCKARGVRQGGDAAVGRSTLAHVGELEANLIQPGWEVYSSDGQRVGTVRSAEAGHLEMELEVLGVLLHVPYDTVVDAADGRVELEVPADQIAVMGWEAPPGAADAGS